MRLPATAVDFHRRSEPGNCAVTGPAPAPPIEDVRIVTAGGRRKIGANSSVLASASPVFERMLQWQPSRPDSVKPVIKISGVPHGAVRVFLQFLYSTRCFSLEEITKEVGNYGMHLLVMSHVYQVGWLKRSCEKVLAANLNTEKVVDVMILAHRCDASWLHLRCMKLLSKDLCDVEKTEAWNFLKENVPWLELEILHFIQDANSIEKRRRRKREEQRVYIELSEAMDCLQHICTEGCAEVPSRMDLIQQRIADCPNADICHGLQQLIRHFASCERKKQSQNGCRWCKRLWQLLRLHASICKDMEPCKVPLCIQFKQRIQQGEGERTEDGDREMWRLLVKRVMLARVISCLTKCRETAA